MSTLIVLIGGAHDGREFRVADDDPIVTSGTLDLPEFGGPPPEDPTTGWSLPPTNQRRGPLRHP